MGQKHQQVTRGETMQENMQEVQPMVLQLSPFEHSPVGEFTLVL
jgi:hypothetical protein